MKIGIDLGGTKTEGILIDNNGKELTRHRIKTETNYEGTINGIKSIVVNFEKNFKVKNPQKDSDFFERPYMSILIAS